MPFVTALSSRLETKRAFKAQIAGVLPIFPPYRAPVAPRIGRMLTRKGLDFRCIQSVTVCVL